MQPLNILLATKEDSTQTLLRPMFLSLLNTMHQMPASVITAESSVQTLA
jgi:hypothetical protein